MINLNIPNGKEINIKNAVFDFNGTMATDGILDTTIIDKIAELSKVLDIYILSSDTYGSVREQCKNLPLEIEIVKNAIDKKIFVENLGAGETICIGNGENDVKMFEISYLSIAVLGDEGCSINALNKATVLTKNIHDAFDFMLNSNRIIATLRK